MTEPRTCTACNEAHLVYPSELREGICTPCHEAARIAEELAPPKQKPKGTRWYHRTGRWIWNHADRIIELYGEYKGTQRPKGRRQVGRKR